MGICYAALVVTVSNVCIFLLGPTGVGKTALALALAARLPIEIVSVDSAQVYRGLDIGTAKPNPGVLRRVPHHLIDICAPTTNYSAAQFRADALTVIAAIRARGRIPLLVGGTGLYFRALAQGLAVMPATDERIRTALQAELAAIGVAAMHARLAQVDPAAAARIHAHDPQRILRALEIYAATAIPQSVWWQREQLAPLAGAIIKIALGVVDRDVLRARLAQRFHGMLERGLINEVATLRAQPGISAATPALRSVGYREVWRYLEGELARADMIDRAIVATRQLAKRQLTWLRQETDCFWIDSADPMLADRVIARIREQVIFNDNESDLEYPPTPLEKQQEA